MGRQHIREDRIAVRQQKTGNYLEIPIHSELARIIDASPSDNLTFLVTKAHRANFSKPFSSAGFGNWFRAVCDEAELPACTAHGLRKAVARRLAEAGCSEHEIAAITGHTSLREVRRYTASASQVRLAGQYRSGENPARWKGHLDQVLASKASVRKVAHHKAMLFTDIPAFVTDLRQRKGTAAKALEFLILTASRTAEVKRRIIKVVNSLIEKGMLAVVRNSDKGGDRRPYVMIGPAAADILRD